MEKNVEFERDNQNIYKTFTVGGSRLITELYAIAANNNDAMDIKICLNTHDKLRQCLQQLTYLIETYNMKHEFPNAYMDAKNVLQHITESKKYETSI